MTVELTDVNFVEACRNGDINQLLEWQENCDSEVPYVKFYWGLREAMENSQADVVKWLVLKSNYCNIIDAKEDLLQIYFESDICFFADSNSDLSKFVTKINYLDNYKVNFVLIKRYPEIVDIAEEIVSYPILQHLIASGSMTVNEICDMSEDELRLLQEVDKPNKKHLI